MRKKIMTGLLCICFLILLTGCSIEKNDTEKIRDIEFTVMDQDDVPEELLADIETKKESPFKVTYADKEYLYMAQGYGAQDTSGYSIEVTECYETGNAIYIHTNLIGPSKDEKVEKAVTYPYVVIKTEYNEKDVMFE